MFCILFMLQFLVEQCDVFTHIIYGCMPVIGDYVWLFNVSDGYIDGLVQKRSNSSALALALCVYCITPSICKQWLVPSPNKTKQNKTKQNMNVTLGTRMDNI